MKTLIEKFILIVLFIEMLNFSTYSQEGPNWTVDCGDACMNNEYGYFFCKIEDGKPTKVFKCTKNPHNEPGLTLMMPSLFAGNDGFCYSYINNYVALNGDGVMLKRDGKLYYVFDPDEDYIKSIIEKAIKRWYDCCNSFQQQGQDKFQYINPNNNCCLNILWSSRENEDRFKIKDATNPNYKYYIALTHAFIDYNASDCNSLNCAKLQMILNQIPDWYNELSNGIPQRFYYTDEKPSQATIDKYNLIYYSFYSVILHELGHWLGIPDEKQIETCSFWNLYSGVMKNEIGEWEDRELSEDDECMFRKLYCCSETVDIYELESNNNENLSFYVYPNPLFNNTINIVSKNINFGEKFIVNIYDDLGNKLISQSIKNSYNNIIDISSLTSSLYFIEIIYKNNKSMKKIAIIK